MPYSPGNVLMSCCWLEYADSPAHAHTLRPLAKEELTTVYDVD